MKALTVFAKSLGLVIFAAAAGSGEAAALQVADYFFQPLFRGSRRRRTEERQPGQGRRSPHADTLPAQARQQHVEALVGRDDMEMRLLIAFRQTAQIAGDVQVDSLHAVRAHRHIGGSFAEGLHRGGPGVGA